MSPHFFPKVLHLVSYTLSNNFLSELDLAYVKLIKVSAPDGTIPIKLSLSIQPDAFSLNKWNF